MEAGMSGFQLQQIGYNLALSTEPLKHQELGMVNMIRASIFNGRKDPTEGILKRLVVTEIKNWLARTNYGGDSPVAVPVFTLDTEGPRIKSIRWRLQGKLEKDVGQGMCLSRGAGEGLCEDTKLEYVRVLCRVGIR